MSDREKIKKYLVDKLSEVLHLHTENAIVCRNVYQEAITFVDSMDEKPVSEDLEKEIQDYYNSRREYSGRYNAVIPVYKHQLIDIARHFANWQKNHLWKPADGDDLPEIDREVIAILDYDFGHYKVVYAHRPNPNGWNGTNIDTGEKEHFEPEIYDKGGWNQPHVLYWLDYDINELLCR